MRELRGEDLPDPREAQADRVADLPVRHSVRAHLLEDDLPTDRRYLLDRFHERCELAEAHSGRLCPHLIEVRVDLGEHEQGRGRGDRKSTRLNSSHVKISYAVFCLKKKNTLNPYRNENVHGRALMHA